jgi:hypothetical protein
MRGIFGAVIGVMLSLALVSSASADQADDLSAQAGVHGGLVVILDANSGLASQFQSKGGWLVHVLCASQQEATTVRGRRGHCTHLP